MLTSLPMLSLGRELCGRLTRLADGLLAWQERSRGRRTLMSLSDHQLHDVGLSRADVEAEWSKPFWRT
jgi:uncharacterized protein YjiS (DUF1127 family)